jgi:hypothetical protein
MDPRALLLQRNQSVERRSSGALSSLIVSDLIGPILALSTRGVSTLPLTSARKASAERVRGCSERGRAMARAISICVPP